MENFKEHLLGHSKSINNEEITDQIRKTRVVSLIWFFKRKVTKLLGFMQGLLLEIDDPEGIESIEDLKGEWQELVAELAQKGTKEKVCTMYQFGRDIVKYLMVHGHDWAEWKAYMEDNSLLDIFMVSNLWAQRNTLWIMGTICSLLLYSSTDGLYR